MRLQNPTPRLATSFGLLLALLVPGGLQAQFGVAARVSTLGLGVEVFPMGGAFHLSGGLLVNGNEGTLTARLNQNIDIGGTTYTPDEVGSLLGTVDFRSTAPYLGLGFAGRGRVALLFDLGVGFTGTPRVDLVGQTPLTGAAKAQFDANVAQELAEVRADIEDKSYLKLHPVVALGVKIGF